MTGMQMSSAYPSLMSKTTMDGIELMGGGMNGINNENMGG